MSDDAGIDKQRILDEIVGVSSSPPPPPPPAPAPPAPVPEPAPVVVPALAARLPGARYRRRSRAAALVMLFAGLVWIGVALATRQVAPAWVGTALVVPALAALAWHSLLP
jgi:hypothetical protein